LGRFDIEALEPEKQQMFVSQARAATSSASRYLVQLCKHWSHKFPVEYTPAWGRVPFPSGAVCTFEARDGSLAMTVDAPDEETLVRMQTVVGEHLKRFAFREDLGEINWTRRSREQDA
jgi:hypothetical protein